MQLVVGRMKRQCFLAVRLATIRKYRKWMLLFVVTAGCKTIDVHFSVQKKIKNYWGRVNVVYSRSLNYQWELDDYTDPYYHAGTDVNNLHVNFNLTYHFNSKKKYKLNKVYP